MRRLVAILHLGQTLPRPARGRHVKGGVMPGVQDINRNDLGVMGAGVLAFIASFLP